MIRNFRPMSQWWRLCCVLFWGLTAFQSHFIFYSQTSSPSFAQTQGPAAVRTHLVCENIVGTYTCAKCPTSCQLPTVVHHLCGYFPNGGTSNGISFLKQSLRNSVSCLFNFRTVRMVHNPAPVGRKSGKYQDASSNECNGLSHEFRLAFSWQTVPTPTQNSPRCRKMSGKPRHVRPRRQTQSQRVPVWTISRYSRPESGRSRHQPAGMRHTFAS